MSKHKSEVLTVKSKLKVEFPQAAITEIGTFPPVIPKMFRIAMWWKTRTAGSDIIYVKPLICVVGK